MENAGLAFILTRLQRFIPQRSIQDLDREIKINSCSFYKKTKVNDAVELEYTLIRFDDGSFKIKDTELIN